MLLRFILFSAFMAVVYGLVCHYEVDDYFINEGKHADVIEVKPRADQACSNVVFCHSGFKCMRFVFKDEVVYRGCSSRCDIAWKNDPYGKYIRCCERDFCNESRYEAIARELIKPCVWFTLILGQNPDKIRRSRKLCMFLRPYKKRHLLHYMIDNPQEGRLSRKRKKLKASALLPTAASKMALNVNRSVADPFYRYKMPKLLAKVEGKGNGIKTVIANMTDIAKSLERPAMYPTKYFGCELGAQTNFDAKNERYIVNGEHDANKLQDMLDGFIKKFVLCPACDNPETTLSVRRNQIHSKCKACGNSFVIDNRHKLSGYIVKNPPKIEIDFTKLKEMPKKEEEEVDRSSDDIDDDDDWAPEPLPEDGKLTAGIGKLVIDRDLEKSIDERLDMMEKHFIKAKEHNSVGDGKALIDEAERLDVKQKAALVLAVTLLNENILKERQIQQYRKAFIRFTINDKKAQRYFLHGIEMLIISHEKELLPFAPHIIKALYDNDILEEDAILAWGEKPSSKYVNKSQAKKVIEKCDKVLTWLREAEEEEDDDEEEEDDEVAFDNGNHKTNGISKAHIETPKEEVKVKTEDGQEIDIDDI